jgi:hypothetical protein
MDIDAFIAHLVDLCTQYADAELLGLSSTTDESKEMYGIRAWTLKAHIEDDLRYFGQMYASVMITDNSAN